MIAIAASAIHGGRTKSAMTMALVLIIMVAAHLARRRTTPWRRHSWSGWPNSGWLSSQRDSRGELRLAAQAASSTNGTVGNTGKNMPTMASARQTTASASSSQRTGAGSIVLSGGSGANGGRGRKGSWVDMFMIVPPAAMLGIHDLP